MRKSNPVTDAIDEAMEHHKIPPAGIGNGYARTAERYIYGVTVSALTNLGWDMEDAQKAAEKNTGCIRSRVDKCLKGKRR